MSGIYIGKDMVLLEQFNIQEDDEGEITYSFFVYSEGEMEGMVTAFKTYPVMTGEMIL